MPHTPGPWHTAARDNDYQSEVTQEVSGKTVALTYTSNDADAYLIAAAPRMLASLKLADKINVALTDAGLFDTLAGDVHPDEINAACDAVRAAIAEAEGR